MYVRLIFTLHVCMYVCTPVSIYMYHICIWYPKRSEEEVISPWNWSYTWFVSCLLCVLGTKPGSSAQTVRALNRCATSPAPVCLVLHQGKLNINKAHEACQGSLALGEGKRLKSKLLHAILWYIILV